VRAPVGDHVGIVKSVALVLLAASCGPFVSVQPIDPAPHALAAHTPDSVALLEEDPSQPHVEVAQLGATETQDIAKLTAALRAPRRTAATRSSSTSRRMTSRRPRDRTRSRRRRDGVRTCSPCSTTIRPATACTV